MTKRKNLKINVEMYERLREEKGQYETWDGALNRMLDELDSGRNAPDTHSDEYKQGQADALSALLGSPLLDERTKSDIRHTAYEDRSIPKARVDEAIEKGGRDND